MSLMLSLIHGNTAFLGARGLDDRLSVSLNYVNIKNCISGDMMAWVVQINIQTINQLEMLISV